MTDPRSVLARLEDFRLLPVFVGLSMAIGIAIGDVLEISDSLLTPPIEALKTIAAGTFVWSATRLAPRLFPGPTDPRGIDLLACRACQTVSPCCC